MNAYRWKEELRRQAAEGLQWGLDPNGRRFSATYRGSASWAQNVYMNATQSIYAQRRARLASMLGAGGIAIIPTAPERPRNRDTDFIYRHDSYLLPDRFCRAWCQCWCSRPRAQHAVLPAQGSGARNLGRLPPGPRRRARSAGVNAAQSSAVLDAQLPRLLENRSCVWYPFATHGPGGAGGGLAQRRAPACVTERCAQRNKAMCAPCSTRCASSRTRMSWTSCAAPARSAPRPISAPMQRSARMLRAGQDVREYHLDAELLHAFREGGSQSPAYGSIVAAGANACVLHYQADAAPVRDGELVLIDAGCELDGYASDITRTFPANGKFTARSARCTTWCWPARTPPSQPPRPVRASTTRTTPRWPCWRRACSTWGCWTRTRWAPPRT